MKPALILGGLMLLAAAPALAQPRPAGPAGVGEAPSALDQQVGVPPSDASLLGSMPMPQGAKIRADQSVIIGSGDSWVGRVTIDVGRDVTAAYKYFLDGFQAQGWALQSAVRSKNSLLVFTRSGRSATIEFSDTPRIVGGTTVTITMAPMGSVARY